MYTKTTKVHINNLNSFLKRALFLPWDRVLKKRTQGNMVFVTLQLKRIELWTSI